MGYNFILGASGAGKTELCLAQIVSAQDGGCKNAVIYIVPEQFSLQSEKNLLRAAGGRGLMKAQVLSFQRLAYHVFSEVGATDRRPLEDTGKHMLLRRVLFDVKDKLRFFKGAADKQGFIDSLSEAVTEFYRHNISPETLSEAAAASQDENLRIKLEDLYNIFTRYRQYLSDNFISADETLDILAERIERSPLVRGAEVWIDGFNGFTPQEYGVLERLLACAKNMTFALTVGGIAASAGEDCVFWADVSETDPFYETKTTVNLINRLAASCGAERGETRLLKENMRHRRHCDLAFLEESFFKANVLPHEGNCENVKMVYADNMYDEIDYAAKKITELTRERGYSYGEIAVVSCSSEDYEKNIKAVFSRYNLPVFIDVKKDILSHPLIEFIRASLDVIAYNWQYESVFRLLKTNLLPIRREEVDLLENYVLAYGIKRDRWKSPWLYGFGGRYERFDEETVNALRRQVVDTLEPLSLCFNRSERYGVGDICTALYSFLESCGVTGVLRSWAEQAALDGRVGLYREHTQMWDKIMSLLDKMVDILGGEKLTLGEFGKILEAGFSGTKLGLAPPALEQIIVGDLRRTRLPEIKALFLLGANEGALPAKSPDDGLLSDDGRRLLRLKDSLMKAYEEQFSIYACIAKPSEFLCVSCYLGGLDGKSLRPSLTLDKITELLPAVERITLSRMPEDSLFNISFAEPAFSELTARLRGFTDGVPGLYKDAYGYFSERGEYKTRLEQIKGLIRGDNKYERLSAESIGRLYPGALKTSVSKLERYAQCPFSYFAQYNLNVAERKIYGVESVDLGNIFHNVLERFAAHLDAENLSMTSADRERLDAVTEKSIDEAFAMEHNEIFKSSAQYAYFAQRVKDISVRSIWAITEHMRGGAFETAFVEAAFSVGKDGGMRDFGAILLTLDNGAEMLLEGRIDRVDVAVLDGDAYVKIVDYKSGNKKFSFAEVLYGLQLQLIIYMDAFVKKYGEKLEGKGVKVNPAAAFYFRLLNPVIDYSAKLLAEEGLEGELLKQFKASGVSVDEPSVLNALGGGAGKKADAVPGVMLSMDGFKRLMDYAAGKAREIGAEILNGGIPAAPYKFKGNTGCKYCAYKPICKLDIVHNAQKVRSLRPINEKNAATEMLTIED